MQAINEKNGKNVKRLTTILQPERKEEVENPWKMKENENKDWIKALKSVV